MRLGRHELNLLEATAGREWLITNGLGGFASSTVAGMNTRRYHGWLVAQVVTFGGRFVALSKFEEEVRVGGQTYPLSTDRFTGSGGQGPVVTPKGYRRLHGFALDPLPRFVYQVKGLFIERCLHLVHGENRVVAIYKLDGWSPSEVSLRLRPLLTFRFYHHLLRRNDWPFETEAGPGQVSVRPYEGCPRIVIEHQPGVWSAGGVWYTDFDYLDEERRGLDHVEDLYSPGFLSFDGLGAGDVVAVSAAVVEDGAPVSTGVVEDGASRDGHGEAGQGGRDDPAGRGGRASQGGRASTFSVETALASRRREAERLAGLVAGAKRAVAGRLPEARAGAGASRALDKPFFRRLVVAGDAFVTSRSGRTTVIAGYPWFEDWGRDTLIALPGLFLVTGRFGEAWSVLADYASYVKDGLVPNRFPDQAPSPDYNTADASLWFIRAVEAFVAYTGDKARVRRELGPTLAAIVESYRNGTRFGIGAGPDGLLAAGEPGVAVTWMDAKLGDWVVTPRVGCPVELNALWYDALMFLAELFGAPAGPGELAAAAPSEPAPAPGGRAATPGRRAVASGEPAAPARRAGDQAAPDWAELAGKVREAFNARFWNAEKRCLYDVIPPRPGPTPDPSVRPNQLLAISLPHAVLDRERWGPVVDVCLEELYTPFGLRTLSRSDPAYRGLYRGGPAERDGAYHQGTVWPWLIGPFATALRRTHGRSEESRHLVSRMLEPFRGQLREAGIGYLSEVFDGDFPFAPGGCIAQAWSVAEILRVYVEEVLEAGPAGAVAEPHGSPH